MAQEPEQSNAPLKCCMAGPFSPLIFPWLWSMQRDMGNIEGLPPWSGPIEATVAPAVLKAIHAMSRCRDLVQAFPEVLQYLHEVLPRWTFAIAGRTADAEGLRLIAVHAGGASGCSAGDEVVLGAGPCGIGLEAEQPVLRLQGSRLWCEAPSWSKSRVQFVVSASLALSPNGNETETAAPDIASEKSRALAAMKSLAQALEDQLVLRELPASETPDSTETDTLASLSGLEPLAMDESQVSWQGMVGTSKVMRQMYSLIERVADTDATVLLLGESGTGKELAARAIHALSRRAGGPFLAVNCAALPESLIESELFGHERGSFTGATERRKGRFELANGGTLFLDEIGELSPSIQVKLLRFLQERIFERVGGGEPVASDVRIIAATNRDLQKAVEEGAFRADLYYRLAVFPIVVPPLRERGADIILLADHFVGLHNRANTRKIRRISTPALDLLTMYHWPGNVRELENCIMRAAILASDGVIHAYHLPPSLQSAISSGTEPASGLDAAVARVERELIMEALKLERGQTAPAARRLGITERRLRYALQKYKLDPKRFRTKL